MNFPISVWSINRNLDVRRAAGQWVAFIACPAVCVRQPFLRDGHGRSISPPTGRSRTKGVGQSGDQSKESGPDIEAHSGGGPPWGTPRDSEPSLRPSLGRAPKFSHLRRDDCCTMHRRLQWPADCKVHKVTARKRLLWCREVYNKVS